MSPAVLHHPTSIERNRLPCDPSSSPHSSSPPRRALLGLAGCKATEPYQDAPVGQRNSTQADVIEMPDGFNNAATKCDHGNRVYVIFHSDSSYGAIAVVAGDPTCAGK